MGWNGKKSEMKAELPQNKFDTTKTLLYNNRSLPQRKLAGVHYVTNFPVPER